MATDEQSFNVTDANPLYNFRAPKRLPRKHAKVHGEHFITQKGDTINDGGIRSIYPGTFRLRSNPGLELEFKLWEDIDDERGQSLNHFLRMTVQQGFEVALAKEFDVDFRYRQVWKKDNGGRLTLGGRSKPAHVLMYRTGAKADEVAAEKLARSTSIQQSAEQKAAEKVATASRELGVELTDVSIEEGEEIEVPVREES